MNQQPIADLLETFRAYLRDHFGGETGVEIDFDVVQQEAIITTPNFRLACIAEEHHINGERLFCDMTGTPTDAEYCKLGEINRTLEGKLVAGLGIRANERYAQEIIHA
jgi:hypothetical protein